MDATSTIDATTLADAQRLVDGYAYPPTHTYDVATLTPRGPLVKRLQAIVELSAHFFVGERFLDVGCSKGFFALLAARTCGGVLAIDPDAAALATWAALVPPNVTVWHASFAAIPTDAHGLFDRIWIGNGHHYLFREDRDYQARIEALLAPRAEVIIEGPIGRGCPDCHDTFGVVQEEREFLRGFKRLTLHNWRHSPSYTPGRKLWLFKTR